MSGEVSLALATLAFVGTHLAMSHPLRPGLVARLGEQRFLVFYSLVSAAGLGWMILAWRAAEPGAVLWIAPLGWWRASVGIMLFASILLVGSLIRNPAFPHPGAGEQAARPAAGVFAITRHPMNWSFMIWAAVHFSLYGSLRNIIVTLGIFVLALAGSIGQDRRKAALLGDTWRDWQARTSFVPFLALLQGRARWRALLSAWPALLGGLVFWLIVTWWHAPLFVPWGRIIGPEAM